MCTRTKRSCSAVLGLSLGIALIACQQPDPALADPPATDAVPQTELEKTLYTLGTVLGRTMESFALSNVELEWVRRGAADKAMGREVVVDTEEYTTKLNELHEQRRQGTDADLDATVAEFLARESAIEGAFVSESGLIMHEMVAGEGASPKKTDTVVVHYHGTLQDGTVFDSSVDRGSPARFPLNRVIPCWTEGVARMKVGGKSRLICPPKIAYGKRGSGKIPPNAPIVFEVELLEIE